MKKKPFFILSVLAICLFVACEGTPTPIVLYDSLTDEQVAIVRYNGVDIVEYNGIAVQWKVGYSLLEIRIPGGRTTFVLNGHVSTGSGFIRYNNVPFVYNFENGKEYTVIMQHDVIRVYDGLHRIYDTLSGIKALATFRMTNEGQILTHVNGQWIN
ncbi:MAG: hypothetical protein FWC01_04805 [Treponema sp.]|nr:hypothetical protein [Treponema sp.]MCL2237270.1 hypothetical protein [Treponema sp.]